MLVDRILPRCFVGPFLNDFWLGCPLGRQTDRLWIENSTIRRLEKMNQSIEWDAPVPPWVRTVGMVPESHQRFTVDSLT